MLGREQREQAPQAAARGLVGAGQAWRGAKGGPSGFSESGCFPAVTLTDLKKNKPLATDMWGEGNEDNQGSSDKRPGHS